MRSGAHYREAGGIMKTKRYIPFNLNDCVRVKLTDHGRKILRERFRKLNASIPLTADLKYEPKKEDADGWSRWQLHDLMSKFEGHVGICRTPPYEIAIEIEVGAD